MTLKEKEMLQKLLAKEKEEKQQIKKFEAYRLAKNLEENLSPYFYSICEFLGLENDEETDHLLNYLLSDNFKNYFLHRELKRHQYNEEEITQIEQEIYGNSDGLY